METFRELLDMFCRSRGVLYAELARRVGVTKSYIGQLVHGQTKPPPVPRCRQLAEALELGADDARRLVELAVRERARPEARRKIEELDAAAERLRAAVVALLGAVLERSRTLADPLPETLVRELLPGVEQPVGEWLASLPTGRLAEVLDSLAESLRAGIAPSSDHGEGQSSAYEPGQ